MHQRESTRYLRISSGLRLRIVPRFLLRETLVLMGRDMIIDADSRLVDHYFTVDTQ